MSVHGKYNLGNKFMSRIIQMQILKN